MSIPTKQHHKQQPDEARQTVAECVCSACYGQLVTRYLWREQISEVTCVNENCETPGFVTRSWVARAKAENAAEAIDARQVLQQAVPWMAPKKQSEAELLKGLGF